MCPVFLRHLARTAVAAMLLAACASQKEPAQQSIGDIETILIIATPQAAKYIPDRLADVQRQVEELKSRFDRKDYAAVLNDAPSVMSAAQGLATGVLAQKNAALRALTDDWTGLAAALPRNITAVQNRIDALSRKSPAKLPPEVDLIVARSRLGDAAALWSKAQAAFAAGNLAEAVATAKGLSTGLDDLASTLKVRSVSPTPG